MGKGTIEVLARIRDKEIKIDLREVWYVPKISRNLFSVLAAHDRNMVSQFTSFKKRCEFSVNEQVVLCGYREEHGSLYKAAIRAIKREEEVSVVQNRSLLQLYHQRWGHQDKNHVKRMLEKEMGFKIQNQEEVCEPCVYGKLTKLPFGRRQTSSRAGELLSVDLCGPFPASFSGFKYLAVYKDDYSKFKFGFLLKNKSDFKDTLQAVISNASNLGHRIEAILSDNGTEFVNNEVKKILTRNGINQKLTAPYTPQQNGGVERENRTIVEMARTFKYSNKEVTFPESLWGEFVKTAIYILNRTGKSSIADKSPHEVWYGKKPRIRHLRIIGSTCYVHIPNQVRKKMDKKAFKAYLVGYDGDERYRVYIQELKEVRVSRDVKFAETESNCNIQKPQNEYSNPTPYIQKTSKEPSTEDINFKIRFSEEEEDNIKNDQEQIENHEFQEEEENIEDIFEEAEDQDGFEDPEDEREEQVLGRNTAKPQSEEEDKSNVKIFKKSNHYNITVYP